MIRFILNEKTIATDLPAGTVLLDLIRYQEHLTGTKIGCREGDCGACTVLVGALVDGELRYESMTSCLLPLGNVNGKHIVTVEGTNMMAALNPMQQAMADEGATQCGFCTPGFVVSLAGFCLSDKEASQANAIAAMDGNICRCTGYKSIERAAARVTELMKERKGEDPIAFTVRKKMLPEYFTSIKERLSDLTIHDSRFTTHDSRLTTVGGGTDLYVQKHDEMTHAPIHFVFDDPAWNGIQKEGNTCIIGASATVTDLKDSAIINEAFPGFQRYAKLVSSTPIRNMATIAGNFINASPIGDLTIFFLALDAQLVLSDGKTKRELPLRKLYKGYKTLDKQPGEFIEQIRFELPGNDTFFHFEKVSKRTHLDIASVNSAIRLEIKDDTITDAGVSAGGVGPVPLFLEKTSAFLTGKKISEETVNEAIGIMHTEISPISDARGTKEYKKLLLGQLIKIFGNELTEKNTNRVS
ncbi:MAG TPA: FAD binding domain-containing protein [Chitinophagaceae bacterium]|nr:FAD binding domain-containing protein [Chitinophagaceae bacterium]